MIVSIAFLRNSVVNFTGDVQAESILASVFAFCNELLAPAVGHVAGVVAPLQLHLRLLQLFDHKSLEPLSASLKLFSQQSNFPRLRYNSAIL